MDGAAVALYRAMHIHSDLSSFASLKPPAYRWVPSPQPGVRRVMLDRIGGEQARATSLVRYAEKSEFPSHEHPGGEEILVLSGTFSDQHGDYPAGWYLRNPPGSSHRPHSHGGALIFVKLRQMRDDDRRVVRIDSRDPAAWHTASGRQRCALFEGPGEHVFMERLSARASLPAAPEGVLELFIVAGTLMADGERYATGSWIRFPAGASPALESLNDSTVFVKTVAHE